ncbi:hypothetical protein CBU_1522 [Coxiella burnetii RSA 493]|uniref:Uncharacterized protein n=1 Tax=Coxiella burnetii (strain RSA 493 / Nine Mile phase I) TaxID=227377 RepID=Q83BI6_COXBU|nr:hypothetical protein CBU_1522 [Coxiella burnetii RSA 493]BBL36485.1 hypothetical protein CBU406_C04700 [Coxiella burnetii]BBL39185.1 hypothetical protein CBUVS42_C14600 [Coxiella burnetii]
MLLRVVFFKMNLVKAMQAELRPLKARSARSALDDGGHLRSL